MNKQELMELLQNANSKYIEENDNYYNDLDYNTKIEYKNNFDNEILQYDFI